MTERLKTVYFSSWLRYSRSIQIQIKKKRSIVKASKVAISSIQLFFFCPQFLFLHCLLFHIAELHWRWLPWKYAYKQNLLSLTRFSERLNALINILFSARRDKHTCSSALFVYPFHLTHLFVYKQIILTYATTYKFHIFSCKCCETQLAMKYFSHRILFVWHINRMYDQVSGYDDIRTHLPNSRI